MVPKLAEVLDDSVFDDGVFADGVTGDGLFADVVTGDGEFDDGVFDDGVLDDGVLDVHTVEPVWVAVGHKVQEGGLIVFANVPTGHILQLL